MTPHAEVFRALGDSTRRAILEQLMTGESSVKALTSKFDVSQPAISQHLASLRKAGLVAERREGRHAFYRVRPVGLKPLIDWLSHYETFWAVRLKRLENLLEEME
jgi:DNA-binding transcriptional ArsR family regulator